MRISSAADGLVCEAVLKLYFRYDELRCVKRKTPLTKDASSLVLVLFLNHRVKKNHTGRKLTVNVRLTGKRIACISLA